MLWQATRVSCSLRLEDGPRLENLEDFRIACAWSIVVTRARGCVDGFVGHQSFPLRHKRERIVPARNACVVKLPTCETQAAHCHLILVNYATQRDAYNIRLHGEKGG